MANVYATDPKSYKYARFPLLAALHLLDAFALEMTDVSAVRSTKSGWKLSRIVSIDASKRGVQNRI